MGVFCSTIFLLSLPASLNDTHGAGDTLKYFLFSYSTATLKREKYLSRTDEHDGDTIDINDKDFNSRS